MRIGDGVGRAALAAAALTCAAGAVFAAGPVAVGSAPAAAQMKLAPADMLETVEVAPLDFAALRLEDDERDRAGLAPRFAVPHAVSITPDERGFWELAENGDMVWRLKVSSAGAVNLNFGFTRFALPDSATLFVYSADGDDVVRGFTSADNGAHGELWTPVVPGEAAVIELSVAPEEMRAVELELGSINVGYRGFESLWADGEASAEGRPSDDRDGACNIDVACPIADPWDEIIRSVGVISTGGSTFCTGFMVNNTASDLTPYFMTADHCTVGASDAPSLVVYWNFENSTCRTPGSSASGGPGDGQLNEFNTGSTLIADYAPSDFTLLLLDDDPNPDWRVTFAGWDRSGAEATTAIAVHHPSTDEKRISFEYDPTTTTDYLADAVDPNQTHVRVDDWDEGTTEPGSSGSPLFDQNGRVIGQLHGGFAACGNDDPDWYGRISVSWDGGGTPATRLRDWLDPLDTGATFVDTLDGAGLSVSPSSPVGHRGLLGGPWSDDPTAYDLTNPSPTAVDYEVSIAPGGTLPLLLDGSTAPVVGTLPGLTGAATVSVSIDPSAATLPEGVYFADVVFEDQTNGRERIITHTLENGITGFEVTPAGGLEASGPEGGPFGPTRTFTVTSTQPTPIDVRVAAADPWVLIDGGTSQVTLPLAGEGASADVEVSIGPDADAFAPGLFDSSVVFIDDTGSAPTEARAVALDVGKITVASDDVPIGITDNTTIESTLDVAVSQCIGSVEASVDISHTFIGDLEVDLIGPDGTTVRLHDRTGGSSSDIVATYDDASNPPDGPGSLADFEETASAGTWTLRISDNAGLDQGTLNGWSVAISVLGDACPPSAGDVAAETGAQTPVVIALDCSSSAASVDHVVTSLPTFGELTDPADNAAITTVPYVLAGSSVRYTPAAGFAGEESFAYGCIDAGGTAGATVTVLAGDETVFYSEPMDSDPGYASSGLWEFGVPSGPGAPASGATGDFVYATDLDAEYPNNSPVETLDAGPFDLSAVFNATFSFQQWLAIENDTWDDAAVRMSTDGGATWQPLWVHDAPTQQPDSWTLREFDISSAAGSADVRFRWEIGPTDGSATYAGFHIDDVEIRGLVASTPPACPGDVTGDGQTDVSDFFALGGNFGTTSGATRADGDLDGDGAVDVSDFFILGGDFGCPSGP